MILMPDIYDEERSENLRNLQHDLFDRKVPVLVLIEGCGGKIMGRIVSEIIDLLEPRGIEYRHFAPDLKSKGLMNLTRFLRSTPAAGRFGIFDRGWYSQILETAKGSKKKTEDGIRRITELERFLTNSGTLLVKIYLNSEDDLDIALGGSHVDCGDLSMDDAHDHRLYNAYEGPMAELIKETNRINAEWNIIDVTDREGTVRSIVDILLDRLSIMPTPQPVSEEPPSYVNPRKEADLSLKFEGDYDDELVKISTELAELQCKLAGTDRTLILAFEGWDAAGKGGAIKRVTHALNPRGYKAVPIGVPTDEEKSHNYLWRFCGHLPSNGHITLFDRTWYGRMLIERVENLCTDEEYKRSYAEINNFELALHDAGAIVIKFWMEISKSEQLDRFKDREKDKMKKWKITEDDWKNRSKWDDYEKCINKMMKLTNTSYAPWTVVESNDKKYSRIKVLETIVNVLKNEI